jgi:hypothetical protein
MVGMLGGGGRFLASAGLTAMAVALHAWLVAAVARGERV